MPAAAYLRTPRSIQRYCAKGHLECRRIETAFVEKYLIAPASGDKHVTSGVWEIGSTVVIRSPSSVVVTRMTAQGRSFTPSSCPRLYCFAHR